MSSEDICYVNHKPRKRIVTDLGLGLTQKKIKHIPKNTSVYIQRFDVERRKPIYVIRQRDGNKMPVKADLRYIYLFDLDMEGYEYLNKNIKCK